jgi:hypothetical protein
MKRANTFIILVSLFSMTFLSVTLVDDAIGIQWSFEEDDW